MMRRARLSVRPNVRPGGRAAGPASAASAGDGGAADPDPGKESDTAGPGESGATEPGEQAGPQVQEQKPAAEPIEPSAMVSHEAPGRTSSTPLQRRKRISTLPNLVKPRVSNSTSAVPPPKPSQVEVPSTPPFIAAPCKIEGSSAEKSKVLSPQKSQGHLSPSQGQPVTLPEKRTPVPHVPQFSPYKKSVLKHQDVSPAKPVESALKEDTIPLKELPSQKSCSNDLNEGVKKTTRRKIITSNLENERLERAQKLRDLLKNELRRERKAWREKHPFINPMAELEKSKMTMRDFIYFIPMNNPMSSSLEESRNSEKSSPVEPPAPGLVVKNNAEEEDVDDDDEEDDSQLLAPRVKVAEDGSIILDEESLTVEVTRNKAPIVEGNDPIFERGSTTTYTSFRRRNYSKPWSNQETDLFFLAISMVGTDFTMISHLFPHRERIEIKNKFKKEERANGWRIDKAFREKTDFDFEFFAQLLEKALDEGKKKKTFSSQPHKTNSKPRKKQKGKAAAEQILHDEDSVISEEEGVDAGVDEKENKRSLGVDECSGVADPVKKKKAKRKKENAKKPEEENQEAQDGDVTQMAKKKSSKSKTPTLDTDDRPELHSVEDDGHLKGTLAEKKTRVQKKKPNYKETEMEDEIDEHSEDDDAHMLCDAGEADPSSPSPARTCEEETSLILFTEDSDHPSGPDDLSGIHCSEVKEAESQASDDPLVALNVIQAETEPVNVGQEDTSCSVSDHFDRSDKALDTASDQPSEQDLEPKNTQEKPQGRKARPAPNLSRASVKKVSTEEQSDPPADHNKDIIVGKGSNKVEEECLGVEEKKQTENVEKPIMPQGRRARPSPNLSRASLKKKVSTEEQCEPPEDHSNDIDVGKSNNKVQEETFSADQQKQTDEAEKAEDSSTANNGGKESSIKPTLPVRGRLQRPKPNVPARTSTRRGKPDAPESTDVLIEGTEERCAEIADVLTENKKEDAVTVDSGEVGVSPVDEHRQDPSPSSAQKDVGSESEPAAETEEADPGQPGSDKGDTTKVRPALPVTGRLQPKPNLTKTAAQKKSPDTEQGGDHSPVSGRVSNVDIKSPSHASDGDQERKVQERTDKERSSSDDERKTLKPVVTRGRLQRPKPNLSKSTPRSAVTAPPPVSAVQEEETRPGTSSTDNAGSHISVAADVLLDAENKSPVVKATCEALAQPKEAVNDTEKEKAAPLKPIYTRFPKPTPNLGRAAVRKETTTTEPSKTQDLPETSTAGQECKEAGQTTEEKSAIIKPAQLKRGRLVRPVPNLVKSSTKTLSPLQSKKTQDLKAETADKDKDHVSAISLPSKKRKAPDGNADLSPKRLCTTRKPKCLSDSEVDKSSLPDEPPCSSRTSSAQDLASPQRSRSGRPLRKLSAPPLASPKSENASDHPEKEKPARNVKPSTTKVSKPVTTKSKGKTTLVKIRATQQEDDDEEEDADVGFEDENYDLAPDMQNQAPVFIPFHLRSPKPVPAEIEETVEELEIPVDLETGTGQDLETSLSQHVVDPQVHADNQDPCDGSAEAAMALISMGSSVYKPSIGESVSPDQCTDSDPSSNADNEGPLAGPELPSSPSSPHDNVCAELPSSPSSPHDNVCAELPSSPSSPHDNLCAGENSAAVDPRRVQGPRCSPSPENEPRNGNLASAVEQVDDPGVVGDAEALQQEFSSHHVGVSDCILEEQNTGEEATFILTLVEIPINDDYVYSCDSSTAESLPAPVLISSGSTEPLTERLNPSVATVSPEPLTVLQEGQDPSLGQTSRKRSAPCPDDGDLPPLPKKPNVSEVIDPNITTAAVVGDGDGNVAPEVFDTEPVPEGPAGVSAISTTAVIEGPPNWPAARTASILPVEMPGMSMTDPLNRNLPLAFAHPVTTSKTPLKRPGRKPLGFLSLVCKEKQSKKAKQEIRKKKNLPKTKCRKISPTVRGRQKESPDLTLEKANDSEVPSSSATLSPAETPSTTPEPAIASVSQIPDNQDPELQSSSKSPVLATEEDTAPVSEYFFSDIFMEVDD